jgi:1-acyl-sn-glycerol-3-phosphate acyltransferase
MITFWNWFVKITGWPVQFFCFRTKILYEDRRVQGRHIRGPAIIVSNHTSVFDYAVYLFVFWTRTLRFQMAELLFEKPFLGLLLRLLGGIRVDRGGYDFGFLSKSQAVLDRGGVVGVFPESRIPLPDETRPLEFKVSAAYLALSSGVKIIPVYTDGSYFRRRRAHVVVGKPIDAADLAEAGLDEKETLRLVSQRLRERIIELEKLCNESGNK